VLCLQELVVALHRQVLVENMYHTAHYTSGFTGVHLLWMKRRGAATTTGCGSAEGPSEKRRNCLKKSLTVWKKGLSGWQHAVQACQLAAAWCSINAASLGRL